MNLKAEVVALPAFLDQMGERLIIDRDGGPDALQRLGGEAEALGHGHELLDTDLRIALPLDSGHGLETALQSLRFPLFVIRHGVRPPVRVRRGRAKSEERVLCIP